MSNINEDIDRLADEIASLSSEKKTLQEKLEKLEAEYESAVDNLVSDITELEEQIQTLGMEKSNLLYDLENYD
jgi:predicted  nucleic acid-binding Zn-ribbon protein